MIANAIFGASVISIAVVVFVVGELSFLAPYRDLLFYRYGKIISWYFALVFLNLCAAVYVVRRKLLLKDTGKKLAHVEKQLRTGSSISDELTNLLGE